MITDFLCQFISSFIHDSLCRPLSGVFINVQMSIESRVEELGGSNKQLEQMTISEQNHSEAYHVP